MPADTPAADRLAATVKSARSLNRWNVDLAIQTAEALIAENRRLATRIAELEGRVLADIDAKGDAEDLRRQNASLREACAGTDTTEGAIAKLREWVPNYEVGAGFVAMPVAMAQKLLAALDEVRP